MEQESRDANAAHLRWCTFGAVLGACLWLAALPAQAASHAVIMGIAHYADPAGNLPGIDLDMQAARRIAVAMGVPAGNITELKDTQLTYAGLGQALKSLTRRIQPGDQVLLTYSGHGGQTANVSGSGRKCSEGIVAQDIKLYFDRELEADLAQLGAKASRVVMMNDSCFSGGASLKSLGPLRAKHFSGPVGKATGSAAECGEAVNKGMLSKSFDVIPRAGANLLYIAAAADNEVAYASEAGSLATQAWAACVTDTAADTDNSGSITGEELRACAQARVNANPLKVAQHITLTGAMDLIVSSTDAKNGSNEVVPARMLQDLRAGADKSYGIVLAMTSRQPLRIGQDSLEFEVATQREGYLYIFQAGTEKTGITLLFPNSIDSANRLPAGRHVFPRPTWALRSSGPPGTNHLMALLSDERKDYSGLAKQAGVFATVPPSRTHTKGFVVVSSGAGSGQKGRYGASPVVQVTEAAP